MDTYSSNLFGEIQQPDSFLELMEFLTELTKLRGINVMVWRGQGDINWPIHSGAYRRLEKSNVTNQIWDVNFYERSLLKRARHQGYGTHDGLPISDLELLAKLQHHGAATRLVDFSKNFLVGLWFCINSETDRTGLLLGVHTDNIGGMEGSFEENGEYSRIMEDLKTLDYPLLIEPPVVSKRIAAQHALFLFSDVSKDTQGSLALPKEEGSTLFLAISPDLKKECRKILIAHFDIRTETLFPDLDGFAFHANSTNSKSSDLFRW